MLLDFALAYYIHLRYIQNRFAAESGSNANTLQGSIKIQWAD